MDHLQHGDFGWMKLSPEYERQLVAQKESYAIRNGEGRVVAAAGVGAYWAGRGEAWISFAPNSKRDFLGVVNVVRRYLEVCPFRRVEASVSCDFERGHRLVKALGFKLEAERLRAYGPDGEDCSLYSRVN